MAINDVNHLRRRCHHHLHNILDRDPFHQVDQAHQVVLVDLGFRLYLVYHLHQDFPWVLVVQPVHLCLAFRAFLVVLPALDHLEKKFRYKYNIFSHQIIQMCQVQ